MAIIQQTVTKCYCDICKAECEINDNLIDITTQYTLNDRCYMYGEVHAYIPYGTSKGVVCKECKLHYLEEYIKKERGDVRQDSQKYIDLLRDLYYTHGYELPAGSFQKIEKLLGDLL